MDKKAVEIEIRCETDKKAAETGLRCATEISIGGSYANRSAIKSKKNIGYH